LRRLDDSIQARNRIADRYRDRLADESRIALPPAAGGADLHGYHLFVVRVLGGPTARLATYNALRDAGIGVQVHYIPIYRLGYYRDTLGYEQDECPVAEEYYAGAISLPIFPALTDAELDRVVAELREALP
jgi:dTDP-4-amino-4,6-dideoxygalactose transaminase